MHNTLSATQINRLAQRLSEAPLGRSATTAIAAERFGRLLAAKIGAERGMLAAPSILAGETFEQAEARLLPVLEYRNNDPTGGAEPEAGAEPKAEEPAADAIGVDPRPATPKAPDPSNTALTKEPKANPTPVIGKRQAIRDQAQAGILPPVPDFSKPTHARFRAKLAEIVALAEAGDITGLQAFEINPVSSSPRAMARYRDLCVIAITVRGQVTA